MAQFFQPIIEKDGEQIVISDFFNGESAGGKLTDENWWGSPFLNSICTLLYDQPLKIAWVGDYAYDFEFYNAVWRDISFDDEIVDDNPIMLNGKYLCNHSLKQYVDCDEYFEKSKDNDESCYHPLPLLTCIGNASCCGDYTSDIGKEFVGSWGWNIVSVEDGIPEGFIKIDCCFKEE